MADKLPTLEIEEKGEGDTVETLPFSESDKLGILKDPQDKWNIVIVRSSDGKTTTQPYFPPPGKEDSDGTEEKVEVTAETLGDKTKFLRLNHLHPELKLLTVGDYREYRTNPEEFKVDTEVDVFTEEWEVGKVVEFKIGVLIVRVPISTGFKIGAVSHSQLTVLPKGTMTDLTGWKPPENLLMLELLYDLALGRVTLPGGNKPAQFKSSSGISIKFEDPVKEPKEKSKEELAEPAKYPPEGLSEEAGETGEVAGISEKKSPEKSPRKVSRAGERLPKLEVEPQEKPELEEGETRSRKSSHLRTGSVPIFKSDQDS